MTRADRRPSRWPPAGRLRDDRLVFLAAEPQLRRWASPWWTQLGGVTLSLRAKILGDDERVGRAKARMARYAMACQLVGERLTPAQIERVRANGELPDWFLPEVRKLARNRRADVLAPDRTGGDQDA